MGQYVGRFGDESFSINLRSQLMLESYASAIDDAMNQLSSQPLDEHTIVAGGWELGINTETGTVFHALMLE